MLSALCLTLAVYHEARSEPLTGQYAVAEVVLNRAHDPRYPDDACAVVFEPRQFAWTTNPPAVTEPDAWAQAVAIVQDVQMFCDGCNGLDATHFYSGPAPFWAASYTPEGTIGGHVFVVNETPYR